MGKEDEDGVEKFGLLDLVKSSTAQSGWCGVRPAPKNKQGKGKWQAYLTVGGKKRALKGLYECPRDAAIQLAVKKQALELMPDTAWSEDEDEDAPPKARAPRGALCLHACPLHLVCMCPIAYNAHSLNHCGWHYHLQVPRSRAQSRLFQLYLRMCWRVRSVLARHPLLRRRWLCLPCRQRCAWQPRRSRWPQFAWLRQCLWLRATRKPMLHAWRRVC